jgi:hypothetical protein
MFRQNLNGLSFDRAGSAAAVVNGFAASIAPQASPVVVSNSRRERAEVMVAILIRRDYQWGKSLSYDRLLMEKRESAGSPGIYTEGIDGSTH